MGPFEIYRVPGAPETQACAIISLDILIQVRRNLEDRIRSRHPCEGAHIEQSM